MFDTLFVMYDNMVAKHDMAFVIHDKKNIDRIKGRKLELRFKEESHLTLVI